MTEYKRSNGWAIHLGNAIGGGGEGHIYRIVEEPGLVAKIYTTTTHEQEAKLAAMLAHKPDAHASGHFPLAWPEELLYSRANQCVGFLMPYIDHKNNIPLLKLYNPRDRLKTLYDFSWKYLLHAAMNLASTLNVLHNKGYIIGDINESNILISRSALVTLVDCDSIQVPQGGGSFFRCPVGKPEYTPPELQERDLRSLNRQTYHDNFGLAVLIFLMLMEGIHPFSGIWRRTGESPTLEQNIQAGNSPYLSGSILDPPRRALPFQTLPQNIQTLMIRCFGEGHRNPSRRPTAHEWYQALSLARQRIRSCHVNSQHWYSKHLSSCPWCERMHQGIPDPFPLDAPTATAKHALYPNAQPTPPPTHPTAQPTPPPASVTLQQRRRSAPATTRRTSPARTIAQPTPPPASTTLQQAIVQIHPTVQQIPPAPLTPPVAPTYTRRSQVQDQLEDQVQELIEVCKDGIWSVVTLPIAALFILAGIGKIVTGNGSLPSILSCILFFLFGLPFLAPVLIAVITIIVKLIVIFILIVKLIATHRSVRKTKAVTGTP